MSRAYIALGANLNGPEDQIITALRALRALPDTQLICWSSLYGSKPLGPQDQPDYLNAVAEVTTTLAPLDLLDALQQQERDQGREKLRHWGERCIDLDILLYGDLTYADERLTIPHKEMTRRSFVVRPLLEIAPDLQLPDGQKLADAEPDFDGDLHQLHHPVIDL
ncbi:2-amino-4-hydroxy-6-hydroxymethyldihydropteridine diphosphokinase [Thalassolituus sp.]|uniref:2-amino-4-hydroxy-6- hydroxymethyldihydropteridine diphosphokinase n=1 Tax=Thalassolituus sp. TaxID=2030822 RepID=UPI0035194BB9